MQILENFVKLFIKFMEHPLVGYAGFGWIFSLFVFLKSMDLFKKFKNKNS